MRAAIVLLPLLLLSGCKEEPDFKARYDKAAEEVEARAKAMDADITAAEAAAEAGGVAKSSPAVIVEPRGKIPRVSPEPLPDTANPTNPPPSSGE